MSCNRVNNIQNFDQKEILTIIEDFENVLDGITGLPLNIKICKCLIKAIYKDILSYHPYIDKSGKVISIEEKPQNPKSNLAVVGLYVYPNSVVDIVNNLKPSKRGELEITDLNKEYLNQNKLNLKHFTRGTAWFDTGTIKSLNDASNFVEAIQERQGLKIACLEEIAFVDGLITDKELMKSVQKYKNNEYGKYLENLLNYE